MIQNPSQSNGFSFPLFFFLVLFWVVLDVGWGKLEITDMVGAVSSPTSRSRMWWKQTLGLEAALYPSPVF